jgi:hypothetical protein
MTEMMTKIEKQLPMLTRKLREAYNREFAEGSESIRLYREEEMDSNEFEKMLIGRIDQYEDRLTDNADGLYEYSYDVEADETGLGKDGKPLRWTVSISWEFQAMDNPFNEDL